MKKAQMEIMGLAIIVVLLSVGMLFAVSYMVRRPQSDIKKTYTYSETASNLLGAVLKTSSDCSQTTFSELFYDCGRGGILRCTEDQNSCEYLEENMQKILDATLKNIKYEFKADVTLTAGESESKILINNDCTTKFGQVKMYPLPLHPYPGTLFITLRICQ